VLDTNNRITNVRSVSGSTGPTVPLQPDHLIPCEGDEIWFTSNCTFKLRDMQHNQALEQINDGSTGDGLDQEYVGEYPCSTTNPSFPSNLSNNSEQRRAFTYLAQVAEASKVRLFQQVTPGQNTGVELHTDWFVATGSARYDDQDHDIQMKDGTVSPELVWHEYGHHVANMYGNFSNVCNPFIDEGNALDESVGAMVSMITLARLTLDGAVAATVLHPTYGAVNSMGIGVNEHSSTDNILTYDNTLCPNGPTGFYQAAQPFVQAFWEVLSNRNCVSGCSTSSNAYVTGGSGGIRSSGTETQHEMGISKGLAKALALTPANTTYGSVLGFMRSSWVDSFGTTDSNNLYAVFDHHGF